VNRVALLKIYPIFASIQRWRIHFDKWWKGSQKILATLAALRAKGDGSEWRDTQGSPRGLGQPWAWFSDPVGVVIMARFARKMG